jgi:hypothetical protein
MWPCRTVGRLSVPIRWNGGMPRTPPVSSGVRSFAKADSSTVTLLSVSSVVGSFIGVQATSATVLDHPLISWRSRTSHPCERLPHTLARRVARLDYFPYLATRGASQVSLSSYFVKTSDLDVRGVHQVSSLRKCLLDHDVHTSERPFRRACRALNRTPRNEPLQQSAARGRDLKCPPSRLVAT